jgi:putative ABC transport system permease protein
MISTLIKTALRNLLKNKTLSFTNIVGLAVGLASCIVILAYIGYELSYDRFNEKA